MLSSPSIWLNRIGLLVIMLTAAVVVIDRFALLPQVRPLTNLLYVWVLLLAGFALLLGITSLLWVHIERIVHGEHEWPLSLLLLISFFSVLLVGLLSAAGTQSSLLEWIFDAVIAPGQATLFALTGFFVLAAAYRYLRLDRPGAVWILGGAVLAFAVQTPLTHQAVPAVVVALADWLLVWPVMAALRGALLGGALAVLMVAVRLLAKGDR